MKDPVSVPVARLERKGHFVISRLLSHVLFLLGLEETSPFFLFFPTAKLKRVVFTKEGECKSDDPRKAINGDKRPSPSRLHVGSFLPGVHLIGELGRIHTYPTERKILLVFNGAHFFGV